MKYLLLILTTISSISHAQTVLIPGEQVFDKSFIKNGVYEMWCYSNPNGKQVDIGDFVIKINTSERCLYVYTALYLAGSKEVWRDTSISDAKTFAPIYRASHSSVKDMVVKYGKDVIGYYIDKQTKKQHLIREGAGYAFFDSYTYPYLLGMLPLTSGYKNDLAVYDYKPTNTINTKRARIEEVKSNLYKSSMTGEHKTWAVRVFEEATNDSYVYHIDKETRRLWKIEILTKGQSMVMVDKEIDYNPLTAKFDKTTALNMLTAGKSTIEGVAFARDNENGGALRGMAVLNMNKKQYAAQGTVVTLIPYTDYFKEWLKLDEKLRKKGRSFPIDREFRNCIKTATVYDEDGHFEFTNLQPGEYMLYTEFGYTHKASRTEVVGYTDHYIGGVYQGSNTNTETYSYATGATAAVKKIITIKNDGDKESVKLKKTL